VAQFRKNQKLRGPTSSENCGGRQPKDAGDADQGKGTRRCFNRGQPGRPALRAGADPERPKPPGPAGRKHTEPADSNEGGGTRTSRATGCQTLETWAPGKPSCLGRGGRGHGRQLTANQRKKPFYDMWGGGGITKLRLMPNKS